MIEIIQKIFAKHPNIMHTKPPWKSRINSQKLPISPYYEQIKIKLISAKGNGIVT